MSNFLLKILVMWSIEYIWEYMSMLDHSIFRTHGEFNHLLIMQIVSRTNFQWTFISINLTRNKIVRLTYCKSHYLFASDLTGKLAKCSHLEGIFPGIISSPRSNVKTRLGNLSAVLIEYRIEQDTQIWHRMFVISTHLTIRIFHLNPQKLRWVPQELLYFSTPRKRCRCLGVSN